jgi:hypothetical protein
MDIPPQEETKAGATDDPVLPQPKDTEVESARLLANEAAPLLEADRLERDKVRRLADAFIAAGHEGDTQRFVQWVREHAGTRDQDVREN